jgi:hypothetical protein
VSRGPDVVRADWTLTVPLTLTGTVNVTDAAAYVAKPMLLTQIATGCPAAALILVAPLLL